MMSKNEIKGFTFYKSYYESLKNLKEKDKKDIINAMLEYIFEDKNPNFCGIKLTIWTLIEPNLNTSKKRSNENSGAPVGNQNARKYKGKTDIESIEEVLEEKQSKNNQKTTCDLKDKEIDKEKEKEIEKDKEVEVYIPTTTDIFNFSLTLFEGYDEKDLRKSSRNFFKYYEKIGWDKIDWKKKVEQWFEGDIEYGKIKKEETLDDRVKEIFGDN